MAKIEMTETLKSILEDAVKMYEIGRASCRERV